MDRSDDLEQDIGSQGRKQVKNKKTLDTFFPSKLLVTSMVVIVLVFNVIVGMKVFSLQKEKAVIEVLKARYESYAKIIRDVEDKEERLRDLTQKIIPLEKRTENAQREVADSNEMLKKNKDAFNKIKASESETVEKLNAAQNTIAELSDEKQTLRQEKIKLEKVVAELKIKENRLEQKILEKQKELRVTEEDILAAEVQLKNQQKYITNVAAANSDFDGIRTLLSEFIKKMDETHVMANERIDDLKEVVVGIATEKDQLATQSVNLTNEAKNIAESNALIKQEASGFKVQNEEYKSEIDNITSLSEQMKDVAETIKGTATDIGNNDKIILKNSKKMEDNLSQMANANQELVQTNKQFTNVVAAIDTQSISLTNEAKAIEQSNALIKQEASGFKAQNEEYKSEINNIKSLSGQMLTANHELAQSSIQLTTVVAGVNSQREKLDIYVQEIADLPDLKAQAVAFKKALKEIEEISRILSEKISDIQNNFDEKLAGMNLSFSLLQQDFVKLSLKIDGVEQALEKIVSRVQEELKNSQSNALPSE